VHVAKFACTRGEHCSEVLGHRLGKLEHFRIAQRHRKHGRISCIHFVKLMSFAVAAWVHFIPHHPSDAKWIRALLKKLREIETIKLKKARGDALADSQVRALANCRQTRHPWPAVTNSTPACRVQYCTRCQA
jgi:hypothetical protein